MKIGYGRVSTRDQNPDAQRDALAAAGCDQVFVDKASGKLARRLELDRALLVARAGDQLVVTKLDRLGRSLEHLIDLAKGLQARAVDAVLEPLRGHRRYNAITALRSLFRFAKRRGLTFADPTAHLRGGRGAGRTVLPMTAEQIRAVQQAAATPAQRLAIALAAVHAARPGAIRELTLDDIDLPSRRITLAGHRQPLGELTRNALLAWLDYRRATWPDTANRHVLITRKSALGTGPVSASYLADYLGRHQRGISLEHIRRDRILQEALATGADPLHLALVFNIDHTNAMAYAGAARNLLTSPAEQALSRRPE